MYYLLENIALTYTLASNVGVIISVAPFFTAMLTHLFMRGEERLRPNFFAGFAAAMAGICLISFNGANGFTLSPVGDLLALAAALIWACYSVLTRRISGFGYGTIQATRRIFFYGLLFMAPTLFLFDFNPDLTRFSNPVYLFNHPVPGLRGLRPLLCDLEHGCAGTWRCQDQYLYLHGAGDHGGHLGDRAGRDRDTGLRPGNPADPDRSAAFGI